MEINMPKSGSWVPWFGARVVILFITAVLLVVFFRPFSIISPGNAGVIFNMWTGQLRTVGQGMAFRIPFITQVQSYPTSLRTYTLVMRESEGTNGDDSIDLPTREGQHIKQDLSTTYNTSEAKAALVFKSFRGADIEDIESTFVRRTIITVAQNVAGTMSLSEIISDKRGELQESIQKSLSVELDKMGFNLDKVNLGASHLPPAIEAQMQQKMGAQQQAQQAVYELQKQETLAKATVAKARGEADSVLIKAKAESEGNRLLQQSMSATLVQYKSVDKWNGVLPEVTGASTPFIDLRAKGKEEK
jgi:regulator of protease activity HflC (stomatin/prohibitin superfamily)